MDARKLDSECPQAAMPLNASPVEIVRPSKDLNKKLLTIALQSSVHFWPHAGLPQAHEEACLLGSCPCPGVVRKVQIAVPTL